MNNLCIEEMNLGNTSFKRYLGIYSQVLIFLPLLRISVTEIIPRPDQYPSNWDDWKVSIDTKIFKLC